MENKLTIRAKNLRKDSTDAERLLWSRVRAHRLNRYKVKRQQPIGRFIVDFVCFENKLVIELDGGQHAEANLQDNLRDAERQDQGFRVLGFWNNEVLRNIDGVVQLIADSLSPSPLPSPVKEEGVVPEPSAARSTTRNSIQ